MESIAISILVLLGVGGFSFLFMRASLARVQSRTGVWLVVGLVWSGCVAAIVLVDVNVPLSESHLRPAGLPAPLWASVLAIFLRFAALAAVIIAGPRLHQPLSDPNKSVQAATPKDGAAVERQRSAQD
jgi:hypothetical protein